MPYLNMRWQDVKKVLLLSYKFPVTKINYLPKQFLEVSSIIHVMLLSSNTWCNLTYWKTLMPWKWLRTRRKEQQYSSMANSMSLQYHFSPWMAAETVLRHNSSQTWIWLNILIVKYRWHDIRDHKFQCNVVIKSLFGPVYN